jgi:ABC-2 type transport system permease protein
VALGLHIRGSLLGLAVLAAAFGLPLIGYGVLLAALCKRSQQVNLISSLMSMVFAGLGGAIFAPVNLPTWARGLGALTPTYWAMKGYRSVILDGAGVLDVIGPAAALVAMGVLLAAIGLTRFRFEETKIVTG